MLTMWYEYDSRYCVCARVSRDESELRATSHRFVPPLPSAHADELHIEGEGYAGNQVNNEADGP